MAISGFVTFALLSITLLSFGLTGAVNAQSDGLTLPLSVSILKLSQFLYFPVDLGVLAFSWDVNKIATNKINIFLRYIICFNTKNTVFQWLELLRGWVGNI